MQEFVLRILSQFLHIFANIFILKFDMCVFDVNMSITYTNIWWLYLIFE